MQGFLVVNTFLDSKKFNELTDMFLHAAEKLGISLEVKNGAKLWSEISEAEYNLKAIYEDVKFILFWDKDIKLAAELEREGFTVCNSAQAIGDCDDKSLTYLKLVNRKPEIKMPHTMCSPLKYFADGKVCEELIVSAVKIFGFPLVMKECFGSFGQQVYLIHSEEELREKIISVGEKPYILQEYVECACGRDKRLQVVGKEVVAAMARYNDGDFRANISNGGSMEKCTVSEEEKNLALKACEYLNLDFAGVDIFNGPDGKPMLCEVNSNAHFKNLYDCTGINVAEKILEYIKNNKC